jgi:hypothetical protein
VGLEWDPLSLVSTIEELLERHSSGSGLETQNTAVGIRHADHVGVVRSRTQATEFLILSHTYRTECVI